MLCLKDLLSDENKSVATLASGPPIYLLSDENESTLASGPPTCVLNSADTTTPVCGVVATAGAILSGALTRDQPTMQDTSLH